MLNPAWSPVRETSLSVTPSIGMAVAALEVPSSRGAMVALSGRGGDGGGGDDAGAGNGGGSENDGDGDGDVGGGRANASGAVMYERDARACVGVRQRKVALRGRNVSVTGRSERRERQRFIK